MDSEWWISKLMVDVKLSIPPMIFGKSSNWMYSMQLNINHVILHWSWGGCRRWQNGAEKHLGQSRKVPCTTSKSSKDGWRTTAPSQRYSNQVRAITALFQSNLSAITAQVRAITALFQSKWCVADITVLLEPKWTVTWVKMSHSDV